MRFALIPTTIPALALWLFTALVSRRLAGHLQLGLLDVLTPLTVVPPISRSTGMCVQAWIDAMGVVGIITTVLLSRFGALHSMVRLLTLAAFVLVGLFLFVSPASVLVTGAPDDDFPVGRGGADTPITVGTVLDQFPLSQVVDADSSIVTERFRTWRDSPVCPTGTPRPLPMQPTPISPCPRHCPECGQHGLDYPWPPNTRSTSSRAWGQTRIPWMRTST